MRSEGALMSSSFPVWLDDQPYPGRGRQESAVGSTGASSLQSQEPRRVVEADVGPHLLVEHDTVDEVAGFLRRFEGVIRREHDALVAERRDRAVERLERAHAGGRHDDVV